MASAVSDQSQFTLHVRRSNASFLIGSRAKVWENIAEDALKKEWEVFGFSWKTQQASRGSLATCVESKSDVFVNLPTGFGKSVVFQALPFVYSYVVKKKHYE